jgi:hypothetical protein
MGDNPNFWSLVIALATLVGGSTWFWYDKKVKDKHFNDLSTKVTKLSDKQIEQENKFVTEPRTREILREEIEGLKRDLSEVKTHVFNISDNLSGLIIEIRVLTAIQDLLKDK